MFGVSDILGSSDRTETEDYYRLLNCTEDSSVDQINAEFKVLALQCHPDKKSGDDASLRRFQILQEARETLTEPEKRREYDKWRRSEMSVSFKQWIVLGSRCQPTMHWAKLKPQTMLEYENNEHHEANSAGKLKPEDAEEAGAIFGGNNQSHHHQDKKMQWQSESRCGVYTQFRNYQI